MDFSIAVVFPGHGVAPPTAPACDPERELSKRQCPLPVRDAVLVSNYEFILWTWCPSFLNRSSIHSEHQVRDLPVPHVVAEQGRNGPELSPQPPTGRLLLSLQP